MRLKNAVILVNEQATTVKCSLGTRRSSRSDASDFAKNSENTGLTFTFRCQKSLADYLQKGDKVVVERNKKSSTEGEKYFSVASVVSVDEEADIELESDIEYCWIVQKVENLALEEMKKQEEFMLQEFKKKQRRKIQLEALEQIGISSDITHFLK